MKAADFSTTLLVDQSAEQVMEAIAHPEQWWPGEITGKALALNDAFAYRYKDIHYTNQRVVEWIPGQKVVWLVTESNLNFIEDKNEWTGTKIVFDISKEGDKTRVTFTHEGLVPQVECFNNCSNAWTQIIQQSFYSLITTGKGESLTLA